MMYKIFKHFNYLSSAFKSKALVPNMDSVLNIDTPDIFKSNKFDLLMALHVREEKQLKR